MSARNANRARLSLTALEDRTVPTPVMTVAVLNEAAEQHSNNGEFLVTRTGDLSQEMYAHFTFSATATNNTDYDADTVAFFDEDQDKAWVTVYPHSDSTTEATETIVLTLTADANYTVGTPGAATMHLYDEDAPYVSVAAVSNPTEGGSSAFRFTRAGDTSAPLTVRYYVGGTATPGTDFTGPGETVTFAADADTADVPVATTDNLKYEPSGKTVTASVLGGIGYAWGATSLASMTIVDNELTPVYWIGGFDANWSDTSSWDTGVVPTATTAVYFDAAHSNYSVSTPGSSGSLSYAELHLTGSYTGTVTLASNVSVGKLELASASATLDQPAINTGAGIYGSDLTVTAAMLWTGGTLNSTTHLANLTITGSGTWATFAPTSGGTVDIGSSINLADGAIVTLREGTLNVTNDGTEINIGANCGMMADPGEGKQFAVESANVPGGAIMDIAVGAFFKVKSGNYPHRGAVENSGGSFILESGTTATFTVPSIAGGNAYIQTAGATYLAADAMLRLQTRLDLGGYVSARMDMRGGLLSIKSGAQPEGFLGHLVGNLWFRGGDIRFESMTSGDNHEFATFIVTAGVTWEDGTFHPFVDAENDDGSSDTWKVTGVFNISGTAAVAVTAVDGENNVVTATSNDSWYVFRADTSITAVNNTPGLTSGWTFDKDPANPSKWWKVQKS